MSDSDIIPREKQVDALEKLSQEQLSMIDSIVDTLKDIGKEGRVNELSLRKITNVWRELDSLRELFFLRLFNCMKRGDKLL
jgi:hypothetical protein